MSNKINISKITQKDFDSIANLWIDSFDYNFDSNREKARNSQVIYR